MITSQLQAAEQNHVHARRNRLSAATLAANLPPPHNFHSHEYKNETIAQRYSQHGNSPMILTPVDDNLTECQTDECQWGTECQRSNESHQNANRSGTAEQHLYRSRQHHSTWRLHRRSNANKRWRQLCSQAVIPHGSWNRTESGEGKMQTSRRWQSLRSENDL